MRGQAQIISGVAAVITVGVLVIIGTLIYGMVTSVTPHDQSILNETICTDDCAAYTLYTFDNLPALNDADLICSNGTGTGAMTNDLEDGTCLGFNITQADFVNITNTSAADNCEISDVRCSYTFNEANDNEQGFYDNNLTNTYAGFTLLAVIAIVLAAVAILTIVFLLRG